MLLDTAACPCSAVQSQMLLIHAGVTSQLPFWSGPILWVACFLSLLAPVLRRCSLAAGLSLETFSRNANLSSFWQVLATSISREGITEVAILEAQDYPFTAVQWHPGALECQHVVSARTRAASDAA